MYWIPRAMTCPKCGHRGNYSQSENPVGVMVGHDIPCPACFAEMIRQHCGMMQGDPLPSSGEGGSNG